MPKGGPRPGAGRPKGSRNKRTQEQEQAVEESGMTPLEYLTSVYRDVTREVSERMEAAKAAAPYVHAKLSSVEMNATHSFSHEDALDELDGEGEVDTE